MSPEKLRAKPKETNLGKVILNLSIELDSLEVQQRLLELLVVPFSLVGISPAEVAKRVSATSKTTGEDGKEIVTPNLQVGPKQ